MSLIELESEIAAVELELKHLGQTLRNFPKLPSGLTTDASRSDPKWQDTKRKHVALFQRLRTLNTLAVRMRKRNPENQTPSYLKFVIRDGKKVTYKTLIIKKAGKRWQIRSPSDGHLIASTPFSEEAAIKMAAQYFYDT